MATLNNLDQALKSGDYSVMATEAKALGLFTGNAPKKSALVAMIDQYLADNIDIDQANDAEQSIVVESDNEQPSAGVDNTAPQPTGKIGNECEYYYFPELNIYAQNRGGQPIEPKFDPTVWEMVKLGLPGVEAIKTNIVKKMAKVVEATKYQYTVTVTLNRTVTFESIDAELGATDLTMGTLNQLLEDNGQEPLTAIDYGFNVVKGKVKSSGGGQRSTSGEGSGFYTAEDRDQLRKLGENHKAVLKAASSVNGVELTRYAEFGRNNPVLFGNMVIDFKKKGYANAFCRRDGRIFFDPNAMYPGYDISHSLG